MPERGTPPTEPMITGSFDLSTRRGSASRRISIIVPPRPTPPMYWNVTGSNCDWGLR
jgi:hypothetical protein